MYPIIIRTIYQQTVHNYMYQKDPTTPVVGIEVCMFVCYLVCLDDFFDRLVQFSYMYSGRVPS